MHFVNVLWLPLRETCEVLFPSSRQTPIPTEGEETIDGNQKPAVIRGSGARQVILNQYLPGEGISPHVDLLGRYRDGISGISLGSGCVMRFKNVGPPSSENRVGEMGGLYPPLKTDVSEGSNEMEEYRRIPST